MIKGMKKVLCIFFSFLIGCNSVLAEEFARLYRIADINTKKAEHIIRPSFNMAGYRTVSKSDFYLIENPSQNIYNAILLKQNGPDCYYYFLSNESLKLNKIILERLNSNNYTSKRIRNSAFLMLFHSEATDFLSKSPSGIKALANTQVPVILEPVNEDYDFSDEAQSKFDNKTSAYTPQIPLTVPMEPVIQPQKQNVLTGSIVHIEAGQQFDATLSSTISSDSIANNDRISAQLDTDWIVNNIKIAPQGSIVSGEVVDSKSATFAMGDGRIGLNFTQIFTPDGKIIPLSTNKVYIIGDSKRAMKVAGKVLAGVVGGLIIGSLFMLSSSSDNRDGRQLYIPAAIGGTVGAISAISTKGEEVFVPEGTLLKIMLAEPMTAQPYLEFN